MTITELNQLTPGLVSAGEGESHQVFGHSLIFKARASELGGGSLLWELIAPPSALVPPTP